MAGRFATLLLLLVVIACSVSVSSVAAEAALAPVDSRLLRQQLDESVTTSSSSSHSSHSSSGSISSEVLDPTAIHTESSAAKPPHHESPTTMSFIGPALAGVLAIVLIGAVVTFKNRMGK